MAPNAGGRMEPRCLWLGPGEDVPNNPELPVLLYEAVAPVGSREQTAAFFERRFAGNGWGGCWRNGIFAFPHYHSTAHEALGIACGRAKLRLGGRGGVTVEVKACDLLVLPAGTGHERLEAASDLLVIGAYPPGQDWDLLRGGEDVAAARARIRRLPLPPTDPLFGPNGPLVQLWRPRMREFGAKS
jgi:uncharacterized protein YjlB